MTTNTVTYSIERVDLDEDCYFAAYPINDHNADAFVLRGDRYADARQYAESIGLELADAVPPSCDGDCFAEKADSINHWNLVI